MSLTYRLLNNFKRVCSVYTQDVWPARRFNTTVTSSKPGQIVSPPPLLTPSRILPNTISNYPRQPPLLKLPNGYAIVTPQIPLLDPIPNVINEKNIITDPEDVKNSPKKAARLIVIRRKKMKKHKLKKFRKRTKFEHAKVRQRRELKKEKEFQAGLIVQCKEAEAFSAKDYVASRIKEATAVPPPRFKDTDLYKDLMRRKKLFLDINPKL